jgi:hypothetical protein
MASPREAWSGLLHGPLLASHPSLPLNVTARLGDLRPRFIPKGRVGRGYRAIARNGRVLLASDRPLADLCERVVGVRLQVWHKAILPGDRPEPYGLLLDLRCGKGALAPPRFEARLAAASGPGCELALDVGGGLVLEFRRLAGPDPQ